MHHLSRSTFAGLALVLAACASSPPTLVALPSATAGGERQASDTATTVRLRRVHVPDYLDGLAVDRARRPRARRRRSHRVGGAAVARGGARAARGASGDWLEPRADRGRRPSGRRVPQRRASRPRSGARRADARREMVSCMWRHRAKPRWPHRRAGRDERGNAAGRRHGHERSVVTARRRGGGRPSMRRSYLMLASHRRPTVVRPIADDFARRTT